MVVISLLLVNIFDTVGTLVGLAYKTRIVRPDGTIPHIKEAMMSDAIGTTCGAFLGSSTLTTYVESASGIAEGGRSGLTSFTTGMFFVLALFLSPVFLLIPGAATSGRADARLGEAPRPLRCQRSLPRLHHDDHDGALLLYRRRYLPRHPELRHPQALHRTVEEAQCDTDHLEPRLYRQLYIRVRINRSAIQVKLHHDSSVIAIRLRLNHNPITLHYSVLLFFRVDNRIQPRRG